MQIEDCKYVQYMVPAQRVVQSWQHSAKRLFAQACNQNLEQRRVCTMTSVKMKHRTIKWLQVGLLNANCYGPCNQIACLKVTKTTEIKTVSNANKQFRLDHIQDTHDMSLISTINKTSWNQITSDWQKDFIKADTWMAGWSDGFSRSLWADHHTATVENRHQHGQCS